MGEETTGKTLQWGSASCWVARSGGVTGISVASVVTGTIATDLRVAWSMARIPSLWRPR